jgi:hypothetical protein
MTYEYTASERRSELWTAGAITPCFVVRSIDKILDIYVL